MVINQKYPFIYDKKDSFLFENSKLINHVKPKVKIRFFGLFDLYNYVEFSLLGFFSRIGIFSLQYLSLKDMRRIRLVSSGYLLTDQWSSNYFHWITEVVPKLLIVSKQRKATIYIPDWLYNKQFVAFTLLNIPNINFQIISRAYIYIYFSYRICDLGIKTGNYTPDLIGLTKQLFLKNYSIYPILKKHRRKRIYVYRHLKEKRGVINFSDIEPILYKFQIEVVDFSSMPLEQQINLMRNTDILIGVHGAGLTNMIFMEPGKFIFELRKVGDSHNNCYFNLANVLNHKYIYQQCDVNFPNLETQNCNFLVNEINFERNIQSIIDLL